MVFIGLIFKIIMAELADRVELGEGPAAEQSYVLDRAAIDELLSGLRGKVENRALVLDVLAGFVRDYGRAFNASAVLRAGPASGVTIPVCEGILNTLEHHGVISLNYVPARIAGKRRKKLDEVEICPDFVISKEVVPSDEERKRRELEAAAKEEAEAEEAARKAREEAERERLEEEAARKEAARAARRAAARRRAEADRVAAEAARKEAERPRRTSDPARKKAQWEEFDAKRRAQTNPFLEEARRILAEPEPSYRSLTEKAEAEKGMCEHITGVGESGNER